MSETLEPMATPTVVKSSLRKNCWLRPRSRGSSCLASQAPAAFVDEHGHRDVGRRLWGSPYRRRSFDLAGSARAVPQVAPHWTVPADRFDGQFTCLGG
jgi:hypothetical protein